MSFLACDTDVAPLNVADAVAESLGFQPIQGHGRLPNLDGNALVKGENLAALTALLPRIRGEVTCAYIDPPYNGRERYVHYDDRRARAEWLNALRDRLTLIRATLAPHGSLWISIDDAEAHRLRLVGEEVFGEENFISTFIWQHRKSRENRKVVSNNHEYILCFAKDARSFKKRRNGLTPDAAVLARYKNPDNDARGPWQSISANVQAGHATPAQFYTITAPSGATFVPPKGRCWSYNKVRMDREIELGNVYFGRAGISTPRIKKFLSGASTTVTPQTLWLAEEVGTTENAKKHVLSLVGENEVFDTPKPEGLIARIISISSTPGDLVLDAYLGSGTTAAVAHKLGRRYLGIEEGDHALTHCSSRLVLVADGEQGGISSTVGWAGGGGFEVFVHTT